jgi:hypothetical protein
MKFRYAPVPWEILTAPTTWILKGRYTCLLGMAFNRPTLRAPLEEIATVWSEMEHEPPLQVEAVAWNLREMAKLGWLTRRRIGQDQWVTELLVRYDRDHAASPAHRDHLIPDTAPGTQSGRNHAASPAHRDQPPATASGTQSSRNHAASPAHDADESSDPKQCLGSEGSDPKRAELGSPTSTSVVVGVESGFDLTDFQQQQQQQLVLVATLTQKIAAHMRGLSDRRNWAIWEDRAISLARDPWVTEGRVWAWAYSIYRAKDVRNPGPVLAGHLARHEEPPRLPDHICRNCWWPIYSCRCEDSDDAA